MKLNGVDFWSGHRNSASIFSGLGGMLGPFTVAIDEKVRLGLPFRVAFKTQQYAAERGNGLTAFVKQATKDSSNFAFIVGVTDIKTNQLIYKIEMKCFLRDYAWGNNTKELLLVIQPKEIYETHNKRLQAIFGKGMHHSYANHQFANS